MSYVLWWLVTVILSSGLSECLLEKTYPLQSLYKVVIETPICITEDKQILICSLLKSNLMNFKECSLSPPVDCSINLHVSFNSYINESFTKTSLYSLFQKYPLNITNTPVTQLHVLDVNECQGEMNLCSQNSICRNSLGTYRCQCLMGYSSPSQRVNDGTVCLQSCQFKRCLNSGTCVPAVNEADHVTCRCLEGYSGSHCEQKTALDTTVVIVIGTACGLAGAVGLSLIIYAIYRVTCYKESGISDEERSRLSVYKPSSYGDDIKPEYDMNDGKMSLRSTRSLKPSVSGGILSLRNDGLKFGRREWDELSSNVDPTETLSPIQQQIEIKANVHKTGSVRSTDSMDYFA